MFEIERYTDAQAGEWNAFVRSSKNGTFLFDRGYMDYHADRFADASLMCRRDGRLYALLPANRDGDALYTHQGLTYGGLVTGAEATASGVLHLLEQMNARWRSEGVRRVVYKPVPYIYVSMPADEDLYALFRCGARLVTRGISTAMPYANLCRWHKDRRTALNRAHRHGVEVKVTTHIDDFWPILTANLRERHHTTPVHSLEEMRHLIAMCPGHIALYEARLPDGTPVGGMLVYRTARVLHSQYLAASAEGKRCGAIEAIMEAVLQAEGFAYFDFGISTEDGGHVLNEGLIYQKEGFGGRAVCYDTYAYDL